MNNLTAEVTLIDVSLISSQRGEGCPLGQAQGMVATAVRALGRTHLFYPVQRSAIKAGHQQACRAVYQNRFCFCVHG